MRRYILAVIFFVLFGTSPSFADTIYIGDITKINMRSGKGVDYRIIAMLDTGQTVELLEQSDGWAKIRLGDGKEGWVLSRMLTDQEPCGRALERTQKELARLREAMAELTTENSRLSEENSLLGQENTQNSQTASNLQKEYNSLKAESADFFTVKQQLEAARRETERQKNIAESAEAELKELRRDTRWRWFLSGAAVLLTGIILGGVNRKRKSGSLLR
ncbi:SH3 type 3 domain protein [Desulfatibacillum aliphaticivorans]|uniref:SH3 type 3 domain protein n=1 Tax=Desulfatibacillum aliphaticivorans TaxID=218208 RepID=B8FMH3_DESAL|nr:TIGR04211 family SH3 domain-containing protein [Desulfatibacillum aliphaticivorans]ACL06011.1 SH3 type 3 domain protein [Desulfatibacillum aliphaticivorans]